MMAVQIPPARLVQIAAAVFPDQPRKPLPRLRLRPKASVIPQTVDGRP